jgi:hypothetical protein
MKWLKVIKSEILVLPWYDHPTELTPRWLVDVHQHSRSLVPPGLREMTTVKGNNRRAAEAEGKERKCWLERMGYNNGTELRCKGLRKVLEKEEVRG